MPRINLWIDDELKAQIDALTPLLRPSIAARQGIKDEIARLEAEFGPEFLAKVRKLRKPKP
jgi:hypothetical protein